MGSSLRKHRHISHALASPQKHKIIMFEHIDFGHSNISFLFGKCCFNDEVVHLDCIAHSFLYDIASNTFRPLMILTNTRCSFGSIDSYGVLVQTGSDGKGKRVICTFMPCDDDSCNWVELKKSNLLPRHPTDAISSSSYSVICYFQ